MPAHFPPLFDAKTDFTIGDVSVKTKLVWFIDYSDKDVRKNHRLIKEAMVSVCNNQAVIAVRPVVQSENCESLNAAKALLAASAQGRFKEMHQALLASRVALSEKTVFEIAAKQGLDIWAFRAEFYAQENGQKTSMFIEQSNRLKLHEKGEIFIDGRPYSGVWDETALVEAINQTLGYKLYAAGGRFTRWPASVGFSLVIATISALLMVNLGFGSAYHHFLETLIGLQIGQFVFNLSLEQWVNDGLMAIFFLLVGIEIKREVVGGELSDIRRALLPLIAALGGMVVPACIYAIFNWGTESIVGWGVPMATDIAFTLGLIALLGKRVPTSIIVFVSALAIADDLGAILVIAFFYGHGFQLNPFLAALIVLMVMIGLNKGRVYSRTPYLFLGVILWFLIFQSGLHATLAGVLTALTIPSRKSGNVFGVAAQAQMLFDSELSAAAENDQSGNLTISDHAQHRLQRAVERLREPGFHLQHAIEGWSNYFILPLFAFVNMGIAIFGISFDLLSSVSLGVILGLALGKPLGIISFCWLSIKLGITKLSDDTNWFQLFGAACMTGVGFTMSIFIATSAFQSSELPWVKLSIVIASVIAASTGMIVLWFSTLNRKQLKL